MGTAHRSVSHRTLPAWLSEGAAVVDEGGHGRRGIVQFIGAWEDPATRRVTDCAVFLRPEGGGKEWIVADHCTLARG
ncbi:hypothetical protein NLX86_29655 [Streptomyces sp. A3M-1-3]|uniref:hypothetical protein n=1 Tax=Streptomyces sp. A3M-1-3 TaxID=2962044 RepID=UPI0020B6B10A|nr:hypothetical protein [Streptomyces sp. A3M-1-3]MCP3822104.1 hypothetical protein [Streptomyces sp. A3M-1-3]